MEAFLKSPTPGNPKMAEKPAGTLANVPSVDLTGENENQAAHSQSASSSFISWKLPIAVRSFQPNKVEFTRIINWQLSLMMRDKPKLHIILSLWTH